MRTLTATLAAAQKKAKRLPYVEAKVYDYEQGIKRLSWEKLYTGSEPDNHHGIAFDGNGDMHRIRTAGTSLYYQKQSIPFATPFPYAFPIGLYDEHELDQWTQLAADCAGPCAIAAYGAKVYIFYRSSTNVLWKYYSHDYGENWNDAQLIALADVLSMSASWWGDTAKVVCFAATAIKVSAVELDSTSQIATEYYYNHALDAAYGIGSTYGAATFSIVLGGKDTDGTTAVVTYSLYSTSYDATHSFSALRILITAQDDVLTAFKHPDCHRPLVAQAYEALQLTLVEEFSGVTAYSRPLSAHLVKDTDWSSATITEPRPFVNTTSTYGLRLATDETHWFLSMPSGLWRAPRLPADPLDLTPYIVELHQAVNDAQPGYLILQLDNSKGHFASPGEGELSSLRFRAEIALKLGYKTTAGAEALDNLTYWIDSWQYSTTQQTQSTLTLRCLDMWGLASAWSARYSLRWNYITYQPPRVWEILYQLLGRTGIRLWNNPTAPKSTTIDNYYPMFLCRGGSHADTQLRRLLSFVTDRLVPRQALCFAKDLRADETPGYDYSPTAHPILAGVYASSLPITHAQVSGDTQDEPPVRVREAAFDWTLLGAGIESLAMQYDPNLEEAGQAQKRADALLRHEAQRAEGDQIVVPTNVAQELYDVVTVTDARCGLDQAAYRILAIHTDYDRRHAAYQQKLTLGAP